VKNILNAIRFKASDFVAKWVATWVFVFIYTGAMITWILLHKFGILNIDSSDFIKWNLLLSWFAGTQASVIMISAGRATERDSKNIIKSLELDKKGVELDRQGLIWLKRIGKQIESFDSKLSGLEEVVDLIEKEEHNEGKQ